MSAKTNELVIQVAPNDDEKYSYIDRSLPYVTAALLICSVCVITAQVIMEVYHPLLLVLAPYTFLYFIYQLISLPVNFTGRGFNLAAHRQLIAEWSPIRYPTVDIFLPICGESITVLENTWAHVAELLRKWPGPTSAWVLDDGDDPAARELAINYGLNYVVRPNRGQDKKSGNMRYAFARTTGEFFVILDADFAPRPDFLLETLPYFYADPDVAIVQTPQFFRTNKRQTWVEQAAGAVQEVFYRSIQTSRDRIGASICVGTCAIYRREALEPHGGTALIAYAEDVHTGLDVRRDGWSLKYVPIVLTTGICPDNINAFIRQQYRWCTGSTSTLLTSRLWTVQMSIPAYLSYISGFMYYLTTALAVLMLPIAPLLLLIFAPHSINPADSGLLLVAAFIGLTAFPLWHNCHYSLWATLPLSLLRGWSHVLAIWDFMRGRTMAWQTTGTKVDSVSRFWWGITAWNGGAATAWIALAAWRTAQFGTTRFTIILVAAVLNFMIISRILVGKRSRSE